MRLLYLTAHLSDVDLAQRALDKSAPGPVRIEACASVRDVGQALSTAPADAIVVDLSGPPGEATRALADVRAAAPRSVIVGLVRAGAVSAGADALVAGADAALVKQREFYLQLPTVVTQALARRRAQDERETGTLRVLVAGTEAASLPAASRLRFADGDEDWWNAPADRTAAAAPDIVVIDDGRGATQVIAAVNALRERGLLVPAMVVTATPSPANRDAYRRAGVSEYLSRAELPRLVDAVERAVETSRLYGELAVLRAKEQRLRALIESIPSSVTLVGAEGTVQAMNLAGLTLVGARESAEVVGRPFFALCDPAIVEDVRAFVKRVCAGTPGQVRFAGRGLDGQPRTFEFRAVPLRRDRDTASALGVMRLAPVEAPAPSPQAVPAPRAAQALRPDGEIEVEIPLDAPFEPPKTEPAAPVAARGPGFETLKLELEAERAAHLDTQARLEQLDVQRQISEAAWNAVQSELERKLLLQFNRPAQEREHEVTRALLEQALREKDAELLRMADDRESIAQRARQAEQDSARLRDALADVARLQQALDASVRDREAVEARLVTLQDQAAAVSAERDEARASVDALTGQLSEATSASERLGQELEAARQAAEAAAAERDRARADASATTTELAQLRAATDAHTREQAALTDVRQQVARLQAAATTVEQQRRALDEAHDQMDRLREALEDALGARTEVERRLQERESSAAALALQLQAAQAAHATADASLAEALGELSAARDSLADRDTRLSALSQDAAAKAELERARGEVARLTVALDEARAHADRLTRELDTTRTELDAWHIRATSAEEVVEGLRRDLATAHVLQDTMREELAQATSEFEALRARTADAESAAEKARTDLATAHVLQDTMREALEQANSEFETLRARAADAEATAEKAKSDLATAQLLQDTLREEVERAAADFDSMRSRVVELEQIAQAHEQARHALAGAEEELAFLRPALDLARSERARLLQEVETARAAHAAVASQAESLQAELAGLRTDLAQAIESRELVRQASDQLRAEQEATHAELRAVRDARDAAQDGLAALRSELASVAEARDSLTQQHAVLSTDVASHASARQALERELETLGVELHAATEHERELRAELSKLQEDRNTAVLELARERALREDVQQLRAAAETNAAETAARLASVELDLGAARASLQDALHARNALEEALGQAVDARTHEQAGAEQARAQAEQLAAELSAVLAAADAASAEAATLRTALDGLRVERAALLDRAEQAERTRQALAGDHESVRGQLSQLQAELAQGRRLVAEVEGQRDHLREALARTDASTQLLTARHLEERAGIERAAAELRAAFTHAEERWKAERAEFEQSLAARTEALKRVADSGVVGVATSTARGRVVRCNDTLARFCGYRTAEEFTTGSQETVLPFLADWDAFATQLQASPSGMIVDACVQHPDGRVAWLHASAALIVGPAQGSLVVWTVVDATDRFLRMRQLRQAQRLDAVRELAMSAGGEIADKLAQLARQPESPAEDVRRAATRARDVAQQLVAFAQKQVRSPQLVDLNETVSHLTLSLRRLAGDEATVDAQTASGPLVASVDPGELEQWLSSLTVIARDALPVGGSLSIAASALDLGMSPVPGERRITPVARITLAATGFGARAIAAPATMVEALGQRGGTLRSSQDPDTNTTRVEIYLPLVLSARPADTPFPLLRSERAGVRVATE